MPEWATVLAAAAGGLALPGLVRVLVTRLPAGQRGCPQPGRSHRSECLAAGLTTAACCGLMALRFGPTLQLLAFCYLAAVGVALAFIDARHRRLPNLLTLPSYPAALLLLGVAAVAEPGGLHHLVVAILAMVAAAGFLLLQLVIYPGGIGWGDVKLAGLLGLYLGWLGPGDVLAGLLAGYVFAAAAGLALIATGRASRKSQIPFGPFLLGGTFAVIAAGVF